MNRSIASFPIRALHVAVLLNLAVAIPLFSMLSDKAEFFVARHSQPVDIVSLVLFLCLLLPCCVIALAWLISRLRPGASAGVHLGLVAVLVFLIVLPLMKHVEVMPGPGQVAAAALFAGAGTYLYLHVEHLRFFVTVLGIGLLVAPAQFAFFSPVSRLLFSWHSPGAQRPENVETAPPIVMVVFDEWPLVALMDSDRMIDGGRFPHLAELARHSTWYRNCTTNATRTTVAIPAILTGSLPRRDKHLLPTEADHPHNLFSLLSSRYEMNVHEVFTALYPEGLRAGWETGQSYRERMAFLSKDLWYVYLQFTVPRAYASSLPDVTSTWRDFAAVAFHEKVEVGNTAATISDDVRFERFVRSIQPSTRPMLSFLHSLLPHGGWRFLPSGRTYGVPVPQEGRLRHEAIESRHQWSSNPWEAVQGLQRHEFQVAFVDRLVGRLVAHLKHRGLYNSSLIVITSDHGITFEPGSGWRDGHAGAAEVMGVPLFVKMPYQYRGRISDRNVESVDILPTVADVIGMRLPWSVDGVSALDSEQPARLIKQLDEPTGLTTQGATLPTMSEVLEKRLAWLGHPKNADGLFRVGPHLDLLGRETSTIRAEASDLVVHPFVSPGGYGITPTTVTALIRASLSRTDGLRVPDDLALAVAVNGRIRATSHPITYSDGLTLVSWMVPEDSFELGKPSEVGFYVIRERGGHLDLEVLPTR